MMKEMIFLKKEDLNDLQCKYCGEICLIKRERKYVCCNCGTIYKETEIWDLIEQC